MLLTGYHMGGLAVWDSIPVMSWVKDQHRVGNLLSVVGVEGFF